MGYYLNAILLRSMLSNNSTKRHDTVVTFINFIIKLEKFLKAHFVLRHKSLLFNCIQILQVKEFS